jgi:hypothetical protein
MNGQTKKVVRQTAGNSGFLKNTRRLFNDALYKLCLEMVNDPAQGEAAARAYLLKNVVRTLDY